MGNAKGLCLKKTAMQTVAGRASKELHRLLRKVFPAYRLDLARKVIQAPEKRLDCA